MNEKRDVLIKEYPGDNLVIVREQLNDRGTELTNLFFKYRANVYVLSYEKEGIRRHTFIDAGDLLYRKRLLPILSENDINPEDIERIIITHRHLDHWGLADLLAAQSGAKITVHANFRNFVEGEHTPMERRWLGSFDLSRLKELDFEYLSPLSTNDLIHIGGVDFPRLTDPIEMDSVGRLEIVGCPESASSHTPDQLVIVYSPRIEPFTCKNVDDNFRPTDEIIFSGDLWLMQGPIFDRSLRTFYMRLKFHLYRIMDFMSGKEIFRWNPREQDANTKEALKQGFCLIRVKPGHGNEFFGSRIIPGSLFANSDLLLKLGYPLDTNRSILRSSDVASTVSDIMEQAYTRFIEEILLWMELGYSPSEISDLLVRIYREQRGGGRLVEQDRKERKERLEATLLRLKEDEAQSDQLHQLAESTLTKLKSV